MRTMQSWNTWGVSAMFAMHQGPSQGVELYRSGTVTGDSGLIYTLPSESKRRNLEKKIIIEISSQIRCIITKLPYNLDLRLRRRAPKVLQTYSGKQQHERVD
jgi:hypothetical protein